MDIVSYNESEQVDTAKFGALTPLAVFRRPSSWCSVSMTKHVPRAS